MGLRDWFDRQSNTVRLAADGGLAALVIAIWMSVWFSDGDAITVFGAAVAAIFLGTLAIITAPELSRITRIVLIFATLILSITDSCFVYLHRHPSSPGSPNPTVISDSTPQTSLPMPPNFGSPRTTAKEQGPKHSLHMGYLEFIEQMQSDTTAGARAKMKLYQGKWVLITGAVMDADGPGPNNYYEMELRIEDEKKRIATGIVAYFDDDITDIPKEKVVTVLCQIYMPDKMGLRLDFSRCELQKEQK